LLDRAGRPTLSRSRAGTSRARANAAPVQKGAARAILRRPALLGPVATGVMLSFIGHGLVMLELVYTQAKPFDTGPSDDMLVDIVSPNEVENATKSPVPQADSDANKDKTSTDTFSLEKRNAAPPPPDTTTTAAPTSTASPSNSAASPKPSVAQNSDPQSKAGSTTDRQIGATSAASPMTAPVTAAQSAALAATQLPFEDARAPQNPGSPFGMPLTLPDGSLGGGFDAPATDNAKLEKVETASFRDHLRSCATLPPTIAPDDKLRIVLRLSFKPNGTLATEPMLIEASASAKGPALMATAIKALHQCQPYKMLPPDKYSEWKVLDVALTPQDMNGG
jgi:hypothetical protein